MSKVVILGDSFIHHLQQFSIYHDHSELSLDNAEIHWKGIPGLKGDGLVKGLDLVETVLPHFLIIHVGSNDACDIHRSALVIARDLFHAYSQFLPFAGTILISQIFNRNVPVATVRYPFIRPDYTQVVADVNSYLLSWCQARQSGGPIDLHFWKHQGLNDVSTAVHLLAADGTHLSGYGNDKFYRSLRRAVIQFTPKD